MKIYFIIAWAFISTIAATLMYVEWRGEVSELDNKVLDQQQLMRESVTSLGTCNSRLETSIAGKDLLFNLGAGVENMFKELASIISRYDQLVRSSCKVNDMATFAAAYRSIQEDFDRVIQSYQNAVKTVNQ